MHSNVAETASDLYTATSARQRRTLASRLNPGSASRNLFHIRALLRLSKQRPSLALTLAFVAVAAVCTVTTGGITLATGVFTQVELHSTVAPLAPAPGPPKPPAAAVAKHRPFLPHFHVNPLRGIASWYGSVWNGRKTASGEDFDESSLTAAHKTLPLGTLVRVTNLRSMRSVIVRINDRGAFSPNRVIDLSSAAARQIGMMEQGLAHVRLEILGKS